MRATSPFLAEVALIVAKPGEIKISALHLEMLASKPLRAVSERFVRVPFDRQVKMKFFQSLV